MALLTDCAPSSVRDGAHTYWRNMLALLFVGLAVRLFIHYAIYHFYADDSYIFMRYARNAAHGEGFVFNPGEPVLGYTSTTFVMILGAVAATLRFIPLEEAVSLINCGLFGAASLFLMDQNRREQPLTYLVPMIWFFYVPFVDGAVNGMETMLFIALQFGVVWALCNDRLEWAAFGAFLTALTRPEGAVFMICVAIVLAMRPPQKWPWRGILAGTVLAAAWAVYATATYGSPIPQSMIAKSTLLTGSASASVMPVFDKAVMMAIGISSNQYFALTVHARWAAGLVFLCGALAFAMGAWVLAKRRSYSFAVPLFFLLNWLMYAVGAPIQIWSWYVVPSALAFVYTAALGLGEFVKGKNIRWLAPALTGIVTLGLIASLPYGVIKRRDSLHGMTLSLVRVAQFINENHPNARSIMIGDIGIVGYRCSVRIVDMGGLVSPLHVLRDQHGQSYAYTHIIAREKPDIVSIPNTRNGRTALRVFDNDDDRKVFEREYREEFADEGGYLINARKDLSGRRQLASE